MCICTKVIRANENWKNWREVELRTRTVTIKTIVTFTNTYDSSVQVILNNTKQITDHVYSMSWMVELTFLKQATKLFIANGTTDNKQQCILLIAKKVEPIQKWYSYC